MIYQDETFAAGGVLATRADSQAGTFTVFRQDGTVASVRALTLIEQTAFAARAAADTAIANGATLRDRAQAALAANAAFIALAAPTNAQTLAQVQALTKECTALIRLALAQFDSTAGT